MRAVMHKAHTQMHKHRHSQRGSMAAETEDQGSHMVQGHTAMQQVCRPTRHGTHGG